MPTFFQPSANEDVLLSEGYAAWIRAERQEMEEEDTKKRNLTITTTLDTIEALIKAGLSHSEIDTLIDSARQDGPGEYMVGEDGEVAISYAIKNGKCWFGIGGTNIGYLDA